MYYLGDGCNKILELIEAQKIFNIPSEKLLNFLANNKINHSLDLLSFGILLISHITPKILGL